jgi:hypothetical protein
MLWFLVFMVIGFDAGAFVSYDLYWLTDVWTWTPTKRLGLLTVGLFLTIVALTLPGRSKHG